MRACHACGAEWTEPDKPGFSAVCEKCGEYLHCCRNCRFYSPGHHNDCLEPGSEMVRDRAARNHCEWFQFADRDASGGRPDRAGAARAKLERLFGPPGAKSGPGGADGPDRK
jgi:hypothetical protein